ncbi:CTP synthase C-terminal region-related (seleno)protein [Streptomyces sp. NPDC055189]
MTPESTTPAATHPESVTPPAARIALVADRSDHVRSHTRIPALLQALRAREGLNLDAYWIPTHEAHAGVEGFDAVWVLPGSPYRSEAGALAAIRTAREQDIPFLGTCGGFQHMLLEYARSVCGLGRAVHAENTPRDDHAGDGEMTGSGDEVIVPLACSLVGHEGAILLAEDSHAARLIGARKTVERYHCNYGPNPAHVETLRAHGLRFTGTDASGDIRIAELPGHPFFLATLFQPELHGDGTRPHPLITGLARAAVRHSAAIGS